MIMSSSKKRKQVSFSKDAKDDNDDGSDAEDAATVASHRQTILSGFGIADPSKFQTLDVPTFALPLNEERYELWTIRMPSSLPLNDIHELSFSLPTEDNPSIIQTRENATASHASNYAFQWGHVVENESFRLLVPDTAKNEDSEEHQWMRTAPWTFQKHLNVVVVPSLAVNSTETTVEHAVERRRAYAPVPQKTGLKRRWSPFGAAAPSDGWTPSPPRPTPTIRNDHVSRETIKKEEKVENGYATQQATATFPKIKQEEDMPEENDARRDSSDRKSKKAKKAERKALKKERKLKKEER